LGESEYDVKMVSGQGANKTSRNPPGLREGKAFRAVAISAGIVRGALEAAGLAALKVPAQQSCATANYVSGCAGLLTGQGQAMALALEVMTKDVGHLGAIRQRSCRARSAGDVH